MWRPSPAGRESQANPDLFLGAQGVGASQASMLLPTLPSPHLPDKDRDKAKDKYVRSLWKLFAHHNRYVLSVRAAQLHHQHHHQLMLPGLLQSLQDLHQEMAYIL